MATTESNGIFHNKLRPYFPAISTFILGLELPKMMFAHFVDAGLIALGIGIFAAWLITSELVTKTLQNMRLSVKVITFISFILCAILVVGAFIVMLNQNVSPKSPLQTQIDNLITEISEYHKIVPPMPLHTYSENATKMEELWNEYLPIVRSWQEKVHSDYYAKFNTRISDTIERLHEIKVITDPEYESIRGLYIIEPIAYTASNDLVAQLLIFSHRLQAFERALGAK